MCTVGVPPGTGLGNTGLDSSRLLSTDQMLLLVRASRLVTGVFAYTQPVTAKFVFNG